MQRIEHSVVGFQPLAPVFPLPQLTAAASASCRLKSATASFRASCSRPRNAVHRSQLCLPPALVTKDVGLKLPDVAGKADKAAAPREPPRYRRAAIDFALFPAQRCNEGRWQVHCQHRVWHIRKSVQRVCQTTARPVVCERSGRDN